MSDLTNPFQKPETTITVKLGSSEREIFMSFGLLQTLAKMVGPVTNIEVIPLIMIDPEKAEEFLVEVLAERTPSGKVTSKPELLDHEISPEDVDRVIEWMVGHLLHFFIQKLMNLAKVQKSLEGAKAAAEMSSDQSKDGSAS